MHAALCTLSKANPPARAQHVSSFLTRKAGAEARFISINNAYQTLSDAQQRAQYDMELRRVR